MIIWLIGPNVTWLERVSLELTARIGSEDDPLVTHIIQTEREFTHVNQGNNWPNAVLVDHAVVSYKGSQIPSERFIRNLQHEHSYKGPVIACTCGSCGNDRLVGVGATHRVDRDHLMDIPPAEITPTLIAKETAEILREEGILKSK